MLTHHDGKQATVPHHGWTVSAVFQFIINFLTFVIAFRRNSCIIFQFSFFTATWRVVKKSWIIFQNKMNIPAIFGIRTGVFTSAFWWATFAGDFRTEVFGTPLFRFYSRLFHVESFWAQRNTILINRRSVAFPVQVDKGCYAIAFAILIIRHGIMGRVENKFCDISFREHLFHGKPVELKIHGSHAWRQVLGKERPEDHSRNRMQ